MPFQPRSLVDIVAHYRAHKMREADGELRFFTIQRTFSEAIRLAGLAQGPSGKSLNHQRRIPSRALQEAMRVLQNHETLLATASDFDELHSYIENLIRAISGIGELTVYDTALRIGAFKQLEPTTVYLHAGTRVGAKALGVNGSRKTAGLHELPRQFRKFRAWEVEDCLCIYKRVLEKLSKSTPRSTFARSKGSRTRISRCR
ncbi:MAG: hypothetical protein HY644_03415 [Acidobacteria bacterium]|nr:hypothetical protein [Acidobacteriota bacterium]